MLVHRSAHYFDVRERLLEDNYPALLRDKEGDEDDVVLAYAVVKEDANRHECGCGGADLCATCEGVFRKPGE